GNITVDTDPENMLSPKEQVRVFHNRMKEEFALSDMIVLGVVDEGNPDGVFNPSTLSRVYRISEGIKRIDGVVVQDLMSLNTVDDILQDGPGSVRFKYLMEEPPGDRDGALAIRDRVMANPLLYGTLVSEDGKALAIYIPIEEKNIAHRVSQEVRELIGSERAGTEEYHITGLPVAEDTFGVQMFRQMAISAPLACLIIFLIMLFFFRKLVLVISPMIVAILTVMISMGTLIATGNTLHIMSSMIPVFLMPIAVVDSVHILSVFFDRYQSYRDREKTIRVVMRELFTPMLYTSLTTLVGFGSLILAPIPPVRVFGLFVAFGVFVAWILTITLVPAYIMIFIPERKLANFGATANEDEEGERGSIMARALIWSGKLSRGKAKPLLVVIGIILVVAIYGITRIQINDNPVKWFVKDHPVRVADDILNGHFGGTYEAYLVFEPEVTPENLQREVERVARFLEKEASAAPPGEGKKIVERLKGKLRSLASELSEAPDSGPAYLIDGISRELAEISSVIPDSEGPLLDFLYGLEDGIEDMRTGLHTFKDPEFLRYVEKLQDHIVKRQVVGKSNGLTDLVKKVHQELLEGKPEMLRIPDTPAAVAQSIIAFQGSHDPDEVWHLVTPDFRRLNLWIQLKSGDNRDMEEVVREVDSFIDEIPPPVPLKYSWAGLTYLNVVWQEKMVFGMLRSLLGSFGIVLLLMSILFRSISWGLLSMIPLSVTIVSLYGTIGIIGRDYDMVMAVLSSLTLGMSIDFAIHYIERSRELEKETGSWEKASLSMSKAPARAITRNAIIIAVGFLPLLLSNLTPYRSVGVFLAAIMTVSGLGTLLLLPALIQVLSRFLFRKEVVKADDAVD
ncbi:MAG: MMPL family transporter, partial [Deltaproteobacteria bacterium]|nr:MMPL family transporter [Deltaproteobacteria bacterium]